MNIFKRAKHVQFLEEKLEEAQYEIIELKEKLDFCHQVDAMKTETIRDLLTKQKKLENRIQRMLFELRVSDEVLTIATEKRHEECQ
jgi:hypothetical protein